MASLVDIGATNLRNERINQPRRSRRDQSQSTICGTSDLKRVTYPGTGNYSSFTYDGSDHSVQIVETTGGTVNSTKQFVWCGMDRREARNASGAITSQYFDYGQTISGSNYFYSKDHLGSTLELMDSSGNVQASYKYDPYGRMTQLQGSLAADFQYAGYYFHAPSGLSLTLARAYSGRFGRFINRDPLGEVENSDDAKDANSFAYLNIDPTDQDSGVNLYAYVDNDPIDFTDPTGLKKRGQKPKPPPKKVCPAKPLPTKPKPPLTYDPGPWPFTMPCTDLHCINASKKQRKQKCPECEQAQ